MMHVFVRPPRESLSSRVSLLSLHALPMIVINRQGPRSTYYGYLDFKS